MPVRARDQRVIARDGLQRVIARVLHERTHHVPANHLVSYVIAISLTSLYRRLYCMPLSVKYLI